MENLLSIVIANYNYGRFLDEAIQSVLSQIGDGKDQVRSGAVELIIIDGGSTDNSVEIIKKYAGGLQSGEEKMRGEGEQLNFPISYWISEKDKGQSDAFNKGFAKARGRFLTWLNADDVMLPGTIGKLKSAVERHPTCEWFVGGCFWLDKEMRIIQCRRAQRLSCIEARAGHVGVWGPSSFFTKRLLDAVGGVDVRFKYSMDNDLWHKFHYQQHSVYHVFTDYAWGLRLHENAKMSGQNFDAAQANPDHPRWRQIRQEMLWQEEIYKPKSGMNAFKRILSITWSKAIASRIDSRRFRGSHYLELFK